MNEVVTVEELKKLIPSRKGTITEELVDIINKSRTEPEFQGESLLQTMVTYESVLVKSRASIQDYISAIRFCAYLMADDNGNYTEAYKKTFFNRDFVKERANLPTSSDKYNELTSAASRYRKSKLVVDILTMSQVPLDLLFTGYRYKAISVLANLMDNAYYEKDKIAAADKLLVHTTPKDNKITLDIGSTTNDAIQNLTDQLAIMAKRQKELLTAGVSTLSDFGSLKVVEGEHEVVK